MYGLKQAGLVQSQRRKQPGVITVIDESIRQTQGQHAALDTSSRQSLADSTARASHDRMFLERDEQFVRAREFKHEIAIERLDEAHVDDGGVERITGGKTGRKQRAEGEDRDSSSFAPPLGDADRQRVQFAGGNRADASATRIADRGRPGMQEQAAKACGMKHKPQRRAA